MTSKLKFGLNIGNCCEGLMYPIPYAGPDELIRIAKRGEGLGYDSVWGNEHITTQRYVREHSPEAPNYYDQMVTLSFIATATERVRLGTGVVVLPLRDPVMLAKQAATLDVFSKGRLVLGVGLGAYREEFESLRPDAKQISRGIIYDEQTKALRELFEKPRTSFAGRFVKFDEIELSPKPLQKPLPIYMGGNSSKVAMRAAELGQGWLPAVMPPSDIRKGISAMEARLRQLGRSLSEVDIAPQLCASISSSRKEAVKSFKESTLYRHLLSLKGSTLRAQIGRLEESSLVGTPDDVIRKIEDYADAGVTNLASIIFVGNNVQQVLSGAELFAREVIPSFR